MKEYWVNMYDCERWPAWMRAGANLGLQRISREEANRMRARNLKRVAVIHVIPKPCPPPRVGPAPVFE